MDINLHLHAATSRVGPNFALWPCYTMLKVGNYTSLVQVITVNSDDLILEAFKCMKDNKIGGVPVVEGPTRKLVGSVSIRDIRFLLLRPDLFSNFR